MQSIYRNKDDMRDEDAVRMTHTAEIVLLIIFLLVGLLGFVGWLLVTKS